MEQPADVAALRDEPPGEHEQVVELEPARLRPLACAVEHEPADDRAEQQAALATDAVEQRLELVTELELERADGLECGLATRVLLPVRLAARHRLLAGEGFVGGQDRLERDAQARRAAHLGDEHSGAGDRDLLTVSCWRDGGGDLFGQCERPVGVETQRTGIGEHDTVVDEVPVGPEVLGDAAHPERTPKPSNSHSSTNARPPASRPAGRLRIVEQAIEQVVPLLLEREPALEFVEHREARREAGLDGEVEQHAAGERVQGADRRVVERSSAAAAGSEPRRQ